MSGLSYHEPAYNDDMTRGRWLDDPNAVAEAERLYAFIGRYVISFQWLEGRIDEMLLLAQSHQNRADTFAWLARKDNKTKIDAFKELVKRDGPFREITVAGWAERFDEVITRLHAERQRRNGLLHAQYLFDFLAIGAPVLRTHVQRLEGELNFDQQELSPGRCDEIMREVVQLSFDLNIICVQLYHSYRDEPGHP
jgi:hypothetical protein